MASAILRETRSWLHNNMNLGRNIGFFFLTRFVRVAQEGFLLSPESRTGPVFHPGGHGELVRQVLGNHLVGNVGGLSSVEPVDEVAVPATVRQERGGPVGGGAGSREEVRASGLCTCRFHIDALLWFVFVPCLLITLSILICCCENIDSKFHPDLTS